MPDLTAKRTLVKSPPELWAELSEVEGLSRHLGEFGEIKISRLDPETTVAWEGEHASGTVEIEASSWGTKVVLTAEMVEVEAEAVEAEAEAPEPEPQAAAPEPEPEPEALEAEAEVDEPEPEAAPQPAERPPWLDPPPEPEATPAPPPRRRGFFSRWLFRERRASETVAPAAEVPAPAPVLPPEPVIEPAPPAPEPVAEAPEPAPAVATKVEAVAEDAPEAQTPPPGPAIDEERALAVLEGALDNLGSAHHRPFSRG